MKLNFLSISLISLVIAGFYTRLAFQKCAEGDRLIINCNYKYINGLETKHIFCNCVRCTEAAHVCTISNKINNNDKTGCRYGQCKSCSTLGSKCTTKTNCCQGAVGLTDISSLQGICEKATKTCAYCAPTNQLCGETQASIKCCDEIENPKSKVKCRKINYEEYRCVENPCSIPGSKHVGFTCPGFRDDFQFCQCRNVSNGIKKYSQCTMANSCKACGVQGDPCKTNADCCKGSEPYSANPSDDKPQLLDWECRKNICSTCFIALTQQPKNFNCKRNTNIPCCADEYGDRLDCKTDSDGDIKCDI